MIFIGIGIFCLILLSMCVIFMQHKKLRNITMPQIDSLNGTDFEKFVATLFKFHGYKVSLTPDSNDYGVDVIAIKHKKKLVIQAKCYYNHLVGARAVQEIYGGCTYYKANIAVAFTNWTFSAQAKKLAKELNVVLLDRKFLEQILKDIKHGKRNKKLKLLYNKLECVGFEKN